MEIIQESYLYKVYFYNGVKWCFGGESFSKSSALNKWRDYVRRYKRAKLFEIKQSAKCIKEMG